MKKTLLFITSKYYPKPSQNSIIINNLYPKIREHYNVIVLCEGSKDLELNGMKIFSYSNIYIKINNYATKKKIKLKLFNNLIDSILLFLLKGYRFVMANLFVLSYAYFDYISAKNKLRKVIKEFKIDVVIAISFPFFSFYLGYYLKCENEKIKVFTYSLDVYSQRLVKPLFLKSLTKKRLNLEDLIYSKSDMNFVKEDFQLSRDGNNWNDLQKQTVVGLPFLEDKTSQSSFEDLNKIIFITYAGTFQKRVRIPDLLIDLIELISDDRIYFKVAYLGSRFKNLEKISTFGNVEILYNVDRNDVLKMYEKTNIFINVSNIVPTQTPSKIYEYMSYGKPIINLYYHDSQIIKEDKYEKVINVRFDQVSKKLNDINRFISCEYNKRISYEKIVSNNYLYTSEYISGIIKENIERE